ncbi:hypothetical protein HKBW3S25_01908, partial [Candidatus Hakubella thermalkaliphila]
ARGNRLRYPFYVLSLLSLSLAYFLSARPEEFIPRLHIRDGGIVEDIGQERKETISHHMPEEHVAPLSGEARSIDHLSLPFQDGAEQASVVLGIILQICRYSKIGDKNSKQRIENLSPVKEKYHKTQKYEDVYRRENQE